MEKISCKLSNELKSAIHTLICQKRRWYSNFKRDRTDVNSVKCSGRLNEVVIPENVENHDI